MFCLLCLIWASPGLTGKRKGLGMLKRFSDIWNGTICRISKASSLLNESLRPWISKLSLMPISDPHSRWSRSYYKELIFACTTGTEIFVVFILSERERIRERESQVLSTLRRQLRV